MMRLLHVQTQCHGASPEAQAAHVGVDDGHVGRQRVVSQGVLLTGLLVQPSEGAGRTKVPSQQSKVVQRARLAAELHQALPHPARAWSDHQSELQHQRFVVQAQALTAPPPKAAGPLPPSRRL